MEDSAKREASTETVAANDAKLIGCLADEYKILQDKIDKIGSFRFTVKSWSITVIIAALFASTATDNIPAPLLVFCLFIVLTLFFLLEKEQTDLSYQFGERTISIELVISRILRKSARTTGSTDFATLRFVPGIAHHLRKDHSRKGRQSPQMRSRRWWRVLRDADITFYLWQLVIVLAVVTWHSHSYKTKSDSITIYRGADSSAAALDSTPSTPAPNKGVNKEKASTKLDKPKQANAARIDK